MIKNIYFLSIIIVIFIFLYPKISLSEPFVVLEYRGKIDRGDVNADNLFLKDLNYSIKHIVLKIPIWTQNNCLYSFPNWRLGAE